MYNTQEIANKIKQSAKNRNMTVKQLLEKCDLSINTISDLSKGQQISYINFAKIADYLNVSVDYLLGRTDNPDGTGNNISQSNIAGNNNASICQSNSIVIFYHKSNKKSRKVR